MTGYVILDNKHILFTYNEPMLTLHFKRMLVGNEENLNLEDICTSSIYPYLIGYNIESNKKIIFFVRELPDSRPIFTRQSIKVDSYIEYKDNIQKITGMQFYSDEISYFYDIRKGYEMTINSMEEFEVKTRGYTDTKEEIIFNDGVDDVKLILDIERSINVDTVTPISVKPNLRLQFCETNDYDKVMKRQYIIEQFFYFICYRRNIDFEDITLFGKNENNKNIIIGKLHCNYDLEKENISRVKKTVKYELLESNIKGILELISRGELYTQHIPNTYKDKSTITPSRFVLITAAFEWSIRGLYDIPVSENQQKVKIDVIDAISMIYKDKNYNSRLRSKLDFYIKMVNNTDVNLSGKISYALDDLSPILERFINHIFKLNDQETDKYAYIGDRIQSHRNNFAHGNIDKDLDEDVILDINILEWVNYAIVFKKVGYSNEEIKKLINVIFNRNVY